MAVLSANLTLTAQWGKDGLILFNTSKTKLVTSHQHQADTKCTAVLMSACISNETFCFGHLLGLKLTPYLKGNLYICTITKDAGTMVSFLCHSRKNVNPTAIFYLYKSQIRPAIFIQPCTNHLLPLWSLQNALKRIWFAWFGLANLYGLFNVEV